MAKALQLGADILDSAPPVPQAAQVRQQPVAAPVPQLPKGTKGNPKIGQVPLQVRWPAAEVKAAKLAAVEDDFATVSDFMLACFHAYMKSRQHG
jgi:hypothetical protein